MGNAFRTCVKRKTNSVWIISTCARKGRAMASHPWIVIKGIQWDHLSVLEPLLFCDATQDHPTAVESSTVSCLVDQPAALRSSCISIFYILVSSTAWSKIPYMLMAICKAKYGAWELWLRAGMRILAATGCNKKQNYRNENGITRFNRPQNFLSQSRVQQNINWLPNNCLTFYTSKKHTKVRRWNISSISKTCRLR